MTPYKCGLEESSQRHVECCSKAWDKDSTCSAWGQGGGPLTSLGNTGTQSWGLLSNFFSPPPAQEESLNLAHLSHEQSLSTCKPNSGEPPLTHSTSKDLRTKCKWSFQSPFLTAVFPLPHNNIFMPHTMELVYSRDIHISPTREWHQHICWVTAPQEEHP